MSTAFGPQGLNYTVIAPSQSELAQNRSVAWRRGHKIALAKMQKTAPYWMPIITI